MYKPHRQQQANTPTHTHRDRQTDIAYTTFSVVVGRRRRRKTPTTNGDVCNRSLSPDCAANVANSYRARTVGANCSTSSRHALTSGFRDEASRRLPVEAAAGRMRGCGCPIDDDVVQSSSSLSSSSASSAG